MHPFSQRGLGKTGQCSGVALDEREAAPRAGLLGWGEGPWERSWEALLEALGKAHLQHPQKSSWIQLRYRGGPPMSGPGGVSTVCELARTGQGGEALPSPPRDPLFLTCARAVSLGQRSGSVA